MSQKHWEGWILREEKDLEKEPEFQAVSPGILAMLDEEEDIAMGRPKLPEKGGRLARVVHWRHHTGKWVVVCGPFPDRFYRSETRDDPAKAAKILVDDVYNRPATSREDQYAKVLATDILEITAGENEFGPISP